MLQQSCLAPWVNTRLCTQPTISVTDFTVDDKYVLYGMGGGGITQNGSVHITTVDKSTGSWLGDVH